jgi:hypothetical protein
MNKPKSTPKLGRNKLVIAKQSLHKAVPKVSGKILKLSNHKLDNKFK